MVGNARVIGVDGCRGGWIAAAVEDGTVDWSWCADIVPVVRQRVVTGIDVPIGLLDRGHRACDTEARRRVGTRRSSVFPAPSRQVLSAVSYADARRILNELGGASMSAQAFGIVRAIKSVDDVMSRSLEKRLIETHPEVSFATMTGSELAPKKTAAGVAQRISALGAWIDVLGALASVPAGVPIDDALDALACAWSAQRFAGGQHDVLGDGSRDPRGLLMRIIA
jgi:predicted RNase H-like nuclease